MLKRIDTSLYALLTSKRKPRVELPRLLAGVEVVSFAMVSGAAFLVAQPGAPIKDDEKTEEMKAACKKADPMMDDKMNAECEAREAKK